MAVVVVWVVAVMGVALAASRAWVHVLPRSPSPNMGVFDLT